MQNVDGSAAKFAPMENCTLAHSGGHAETTSHLTAGPKCLPSRSATLKGSLKVGVDPQGETSTSGSPHSGPAEVPSQSPAAVLMPSGRSIGAANGAAEKGETSEAQSATGLYNGNRSITADIASSCQGSSDQESAPNKSVKSELAASAPGEESSTPCTDSSGEGSRTSLGIAFFSRMDESPRVKSAVQKASGMSGSVERVQNHCGTKVVGHAPIELGAVSTGGTSEAATTANIVERSSASIAGLAEKDREQDARQAETATGSTASTFLPESECKRRDAQCLGFVAEKEEVMVLAEENRTPPSPDRLPCSPNFGCEVSSAVGEPASDAVSTPEGARVAPAEGLPNLPIPPALRDGVGATPQHSRSPAAPSFSPDGSGDVASVPNSQEGLPCRSRQQDGPVQQSEVSPAAEGLDLSTGISVGERGQVENDQPGQLSWAGEILEEGSPGDTADVALAALTCSKAVAEGRVVDPIRPAAVEQQPRSAPNLSSCEGRPIGRNATPDELSISVGPSDGDGDRTVLAAAAAAAAAPAVSSWAAELPPPASLNGEVASQPAEVAEVPRATVPSSGSARARCPSVGIATRRGRRSLESDHHDDMMHAMCMICLEKLSDPAEGGGAKMLGLLDSCFHRYCYTCILEWSKITNKCPQCKARFHTIKAIKELRRNNDRYRGVAVHVQDKDQVYSFVDVRDVVVLDPDVACHLRCLVRRGLDAFQQGWEFSVQCEQCSTWYHGLCVDFRRESEVPDLWYCRPCRGGSYQDVSRTAASSEPAATGANRRRAQNGGQSSEGHARVASSARDQDGAWEAARSGLQDPEEDSGAGAPCSGRASQNGYRGAGSSGEVDTVVADVDTPRHAPASPSPPVSPARIQPPPTPPPPAAEGPGRGTGSRRVPYGSPQWLSLPPLERMLSLFGSQQHAPASPPPGSIPLVRANSAPPLSPPVAASPARSRGRPKGSRNKPASARSPQLQLLASPQHAPESAPSSPPPVRAGSATALPGAAAPAKVRGRPRGSKNKPTMAPPAPSTSELQRECRSASPPSAELTVLPSREDEQHQEEVTLPDMETSQGGVDGASLKDAIVQPPEPPAPSFLRSLEACEETDMCDICGFDTEPENLIVYCSSCNMGVHQTCYGISEIPTTEWYCSPCSAGVHPSTLACRFCPVMGGALKRCTDGTWGHILCAFWIPECCFLDPQKMEPIGSINRKGQAGGVGKYLPVFRARKCYVCGTGAGSAIRCHSCSCKFHLHPMCGSKAGNVYMEIETTTKRGVDGTEHESVNLVAKCPRHNKIKAKEKFSIKSRGAIVGASADPLSIIDRTLEVEDSQGGGIALAGKVTWFDPVRSKYCIVASCRGDDNGDGGGASVGGEPKEGCAHWITVDNLVEAKAMCVQKNGKRFVVKPLPPREEEGLKMKTESGARDKHVGSEKADEAGVGGSVSLAREDGENRGGNEARGVGAVVGEKAPGEENERTVAVGIDKRRRLNTTAPPTSPSHAAPAHGIARPEEQSRAKVQLQLDSQSPPPELGESTGDRRLLSPRGEGPPSLVGREAVPESDGGGNRSSAGTERDSSATGRPIQQQTRLLPSVRLPEQLHADAFDRYPIRGRRKNLGNPLVHSGEERGLEGSPITKKLRLEGDTNQSVPSVEDTGPDSGTELACPREADVAGAPVRSATSRRFQGRPPVAAGFVLRESDSCVDLEPGWPHGMDMLGQVPVMRVRTVRVQGDREATYFASTFTRVEEGVVFKERFGPKFTFHFGELEELKVTGGSSQSTRMTKTDSHTRRPDESCEPASVHREGGGYSAREDTGKCEIEDLSLPPQVKRRELTDRQDAREKGGDVQADGTEAIPGDEDGKEDGEIDNLSNRRAEAVHTSLCHDTSIGDGVSERASGTGAQVEKEGTGINGLAERSTETVEDGNAMKGSGTQPEEMDISSDGVSWCGFDEVEPTSPFIPENDEENDDVAVGMGTCRDRDSTPGFCRVDTPSSPPSPGTSRVLPSPSATESIPGGRSSVHSDAATKKHAHFLDDDSPEDARPEVRKTTELEAVAARKILPAASGGYSTSRIQGDVCVAVQREPEPGATQQVAPQLPGVVLALRSIVREQLQRVLRSASKGEEAVLAGGEDMDVVERIASDTEDELFGRLYKDASGGREYKAKYKQLLLSLGNVRNYRLVASVLAGKTTPADLATKNAVGLLNSLSSSLNCLAIPLAGRNGQGSPAGKGPNGKGKRRGNMQLL